MQNENNKTVHLIKCPTCGQSIHYDISSPFRPFCSRRCKNADITAWANEEYKIQGSQPFSEEMISTESEASEDQTPFYSGEEDD